jgi:predicted PurR-regulated permease PerM
VSPAASTPHRPTRLSRAAAAHGVPLATILVTVAVVAGVFVLGQLAYRLREVLSLIVIAGFLAVLLNPLVSLLQRTGLHRRGLAVTAVILTGGVSFLGLAAAFGYPLANGLSHLARQLPTDIADAQHGRGVIGRLVEHFHLQKWISTNAPKLQTLGASLAKPALTVGEGAFALIAKLLAVFTLVALLLLEGPRMRDRALGMLSPEQSAWWERVGGEVQRSVVGYVAGDLLTSLIAGVVVGVTMAILGLPFPLLWALWVGLVDFLPQVGGALAGIPTVLFATLQSLTAGIVVAVVFVCYQQLENHFLNPAIMSRTVRTSPLLIFLAVLVGGSIGSWVGGAFGALAAALIAVPTAASIQIVLRELWRLNTAEVEDGAAPPAQYDGAAEGR